jgi:predicted signal transduction protein with EAL and GGDEF domain
MAGADQCRSAGALDPPQRGAGPLDRFVPLAENSELIHAFTRAMLSLALVQAAQCATPATTCQWP